jgi:hypothetical protein
MKVKTQRKDNGPAAESRVRHGQDGNRNQKPDFYGDSDSQSGREAQTGWSLLAVSAFKKNKKSLISRTVYM